jgi:hypothetical protein
MNEKSYLGIGQVLRRVGLTSDHMDTYGRQWTTFDTSGGSVALIDIGLKVDQSTEIITSTEDPGDGGSDATSIYGVRYDAEDGFRGIQLEAPNVYQVAAEAEAGPYGLWRCDWPYGFEQIGQYSAARITGFDFIA